MFVRKLVMAAAMLLAAAPVGAATTYNIDSGHAHVGFSAEHFGVGRMYGAFREVSGSISYDEADVTQSSVEINIVTASLFSDFKDREDALKSPFFLGVEEFPQMTFKSTKIEKVGDGLKITGNLTIRDVTKEVSFPFTLNGPEMDPWNNSRMGILGTVTVNRQEYGVKFDRKMPSGKSLVGDEVAILISVEAVAQAAKDGE